MSYLSSIYGTNIIGGPSLRPKKTVLSPFSNLKSVLFDGVDDYVNLGEPANISITLTSNELSISAWIKPNGVTVQGYIVSKARPFVPQVNYILAMGTTGVTGYLFGYFGGIAGVTQSLNGSITTNTWFHTAYTVRNVGGTYTGNIWLNGVKVGADVVVGNSTDAGTTARIGAGSNAGAAALPFAGNIDEVSFWNVGLTSSEILALYNAGHPANLSSAGRSGNLTHWFRMGDGDTYPVILDRIGNVSGTMTNMTVTSIVTTVP